MKEPANEHLQGGRPYARRLPLQLANELRVELKRRCKKKGIRTEDLVWDELSDDFPELPARSRTWIYRALKMDGELPVNHAIELVERLFYKRVRLSERLLQRIEACAIPAEPAMIVFPGEAEPLAAMICDLVYGKSRKAVRSTLQSAFSRFEKASKVTPVREAVESLALQLQDYAFAKVDFDKRQLSEAARRQLALLRDFQALDPNGLTFRAPSRIARLSGARKAGTLAKASPYERARK